MKTTYLLIGTLASALGGSAFGQTVLSFDHLGSGPYAASNLNGSNFSSQGGGLTLQMDYSDTTAVFTSPSFSGPAVYTGARVTADVDISVDFNRVLYRPSNGLRWQYSNTDATTAPTQVDLSFVSMWLKPSFAGSFSSSTVDFSGGGSLSVGMGAGSDFGTQAMRFVVRNGSTYYISQATVDEVALDDNAGVFALGDVNSTTWASWDPTGALFDAGAASFGTVVLDDVTGLGIYGWGQKAGSLNADLVSFVAVVPEPGAFVAVAGLLALGVVFVRRRRR